jgi:hypothetical protein
LKTNRFERRETMLSKSKLLYTDLELGAKGLGVKIDLEDAFGMDSTTSAFKLNGFWRFTDNLRHRLGLEWSSYNRDGFRTILEDITIEDNQGNQIIIPAGSQVNSHFNFDIYKASYSYSFFQDDRMDLAAGVGLYWMPIGGGPQKLDNVLSYKSDLI